MASEKECGFKGKLLVNQTVFIFKANSKNGVN